MNNHVPLHVRISAIALLVLVIAWGISQAEEPSLAGVYSLVEVNGEPLPVNSSTEMPDGERCEQVILKGVLLLDTEGQSAAFLSERVLCPSMADQDGEGMLRSTIFAGTYSVSGNRITIEDSFGTDHAVVEGDVLTYETGGEGRPVETFVFNRE